MSTEAAKKPNLFVIGAMKSATTSLHNYLDLHPEIFMARVTPTRKETHFFVKELNFKNGLDWYLGLFAEAKGEKYLGDTSTSYSRAPNYEGVPQRIHDFCPNAKIIYIMRDPIDRAISQYWWEVEYSGEGRKMATAITKNDWIMNTSHYAKQIQPYLELFGAGNVFTLTMEELEANPKETLAKVFAWLGVNNNYNFEAKLDVFNKSKNQVNRMRGSGILSNLKGTKLWNLIKSILPHSFLWKVKRKLSKPVERNEEERLEAITLVRPIMQQQVEELSKLLGKTFPEWKTLYGK